MMGDSFTLAFEVRRTFVTIKRRPWWALFGADQLQTQARWERQVFTGITRRQAEMFIEASAAGWQTETGRMLLRLMAVDGTVRNIDLRNGKPGGVMYVCEGSAVSVKAQA